jgi:hypothetical protein
VRREREMKTGIITSSVAAFFFVSILSGVSLGDGRPPQHPQCSSLPAPTSGPLIQGEFTASLDQSSNSYIIHAKLKKDNQVHLFSVSRPHKDPIGICDYSNGDIIKLYEEEPCAQDVGNAFGLPGIPVIKALSVTKKDFCGTQKAMVSGTITIQVVPPPKK